MTDVEVQRHHFRAIVRACVANGSSIALANQLEQLGRFHYDVTEDTVEVLAIVPKSEADQWLGRYGEKR